MPNSPYLARDPWYLRFQDLMPHRVREVLLVSSPYDAFILQEDQHILERILTEYAELSLSWLPNITFAPTGKDGLRLLTRRRFDLVMTMPRLLDTDIISFAQEVKARDPMMPVILLIFTEADLAAFPNGVDPEAIDMVFMWIGDSGILMPILKQMEDRLNADNDTRAAGVRVIIVVEDSVCNYSSFLSLLYQELMKQSNSLIAEGLNDLHKMMRMRARPKILLATSYQEAITLYRRYSDYLMAVISDIRLPRDGVEDATAGFDLVARIRTENPDLPILVESAEDENRITAAELDVNYLDKNADDLLARIRGFLQHSLGFGPFIFRLPDLTVVGRAHDMYEMAEILRTVPAESIEYHARRNHFSMWLTARCMFDLANQIRPNRFEDFDSVESLRQHLLEVLGRARDQEQEGMITDLSWHSGRQRRFVRLSKGSIGGKARGLAFANAVLHRQKLVHRFPGLDIRIPRTRVIATEAFDSFLDSDPPLLPMGEDLSDEEILSRFLAHPMSDEIVQDIAAACDDLYGPLAVRSSSLLEDSQFQPFAGIYSTYMLPNNHPAEQLRLREILRAVRAVWASTYGQNARAYIASTPYRIEEEKMAVIIQEVVGHRLGDRYYPPISGVARSYNYYPVGSQRAEEGIAMIAIGLGQTIALGGSTLQFSPGTPGVLPQFAEASDYLRYGQTQFYALDLRRQMSEFSTDTEDSLVQCGLDVAEEDNILGLVASVYSPDEDRIRDNLKLPGPRVVTFNNVLKWNAIPLAAALDELLDIMSKNMGCPVEIEFSVDMGDWGQTVAPGDKPITPCLYVVQIRPQARHAMGADIQTEGYDHDEILCHTHRSLGHGAIEEVRDVVYVTQHELDYFTTPRVADEVGQHNQRLHRESCPYLLIGPGRWGTADPRLGIPVSWSQISGVRTIIETSFHNRVVEPSQGTHFFHNITSFGIGYLTLMTHDVTEGDGFLDRAWLDSQPAFAETDATRHVRLDQPLRIHLDGRAGKATILKPRSP